VQAKELIKKIHILRSLVQAVTEAMASNCIELKFYGDLLSAPCRAVAVFMKINGIPYDDMQAAASRRGRYATHYK